MHQWTLRHSGRLLPAALCLCLSPLLAAQQVSQAHGSAREVTPAITLFAYRTSINLPAQLGFEPATTDSSLYGISIIPFKVPLQLIPVDPVAWANATVGSTVTLRVVRNVIVRGGWFNRKSTYADAYAGALIVAKVTRVREGRLRTRRGTAEPRVKEILIDRTVKLELESSPRHGARFTLAAKNLVVWSVKGPFLAVVMPLEYTVLMIGCSITPCDL